MSNAEPRNMEEFEYWLNCWAEDPDWDDNGQDYCRGYQQAVSDIWKRFNRFYGNAPYGKGWDEYQRRSQNAAVASETA